MAEPRLANRTAIRRQNAETYLLITLVSFAASVTLTRLFLYLTGYPQLGNSQLHIAHVLWGGLILFTASMIPLLYANRWAFNLSAVLAGIGVGLFIDEVGKFITRSNDYFFRPAAPIIYTVFLLTVMVFLIIRKNQHTDSRTNFYYTLQDLEEVIDHDLSEEELTTILYRLDQISKSKDDPVLAELAGSLRKYLHRDRFNLVPHRKSFLQKLNSTIMKLEKEWFTQGRLKAAIIGAEIGLAIWAVSYPFTIFSAVKDLSELEKMLTELFVTGAVTGEPGIILLQIRVGLEGLIGLLLFLSAGLFLFGKEKQGAVIGFFTLLVAVTIVDLLLFYFLQFFTIIFALVQFIVMLMIMRYQKRFSNPSTDRIL